MNAPTDPHTDERTGPHADDKIVSMLRQLDAAAPTPPDFATLTGTSQPDRSERPSWINLCAAASIVALGVGGLVLLGTRDTTPASSSGAPAQSSPVSADSLPDRPPGQQPEEPEPIGLGYPLIGAALSASATPLFELDQPNWVKQYVYGTDELPLGDTRTNTVVLVGDGGPMYDQPLVSLSVFDATGMDVDVFGQRVEVGGVASAATVTDVDVDTGLSGPTVNLTVPLDGDLALTVNSVRSSLEETVAIAESVSIATRDHIELDAPAGFRLLPFEAPGTWRNFSYRWAFDDGTGVAEPVVISTPDASETLPQQPSIEVIGSNLGPVGLASRVGLEVRENRVVNGVDMAYRPLPDEPGSYWVDWIDGDWSYYVIGLNLDSEAQFFELLASLRLSDAETFASSDDVEVVLPGSQNDLAADVLDGLGLTSEQLIQAATITMPTEAYNYEFELYSGLGCAAATSWLAADAGADEAGRAAALAIVDAAIARPDSDAGLPSAVGLETLAAPMRGGRRTGVAEFGSNDCPLWSR